MKNSVLVLSLLGVALLASGCSVLNRKTQLITLNVIPQDATVIANGAMYTQSPMLIEVSPKRPLALTIYRAGYVEQHYAVDRRLSATGKIDALASILIVPMFGLFSNGAWALAENNISISLEKAAAEADLPANASKRSKR